MSSSKAEFARRAEVRDVLAARYPAVFSNGRPGVPLKVGIHLDIAAAVPLFDAHRIHRFLACWTRHPIYRKALSAGATRRALDGSPAGQVTSEQAEHAKIALAEAQAAQWLHAQAKRRQMCAPKCPSGNSLNLWNHL